MNLQKFYTGQAFNAYEYFGAHQDRNGFVFRTYAPGAQRITLVGDFNGWKEQPMEQLYQSGVWTGYVHGASFGQMYKYGEDTILIPAIKSYYRVTPHKKALELKKMDEEGATVAEISAKMGGVLKKAMLDGDLDEGLNIIDGAIGSITSIKSAADIVKDFFDGVEF